VGRWGNFFNQEAFGCNTDSLFGMTGGRIQSWITSSYTSTACYQNLGIALDADQPVHPCFLYESVWCLVGFLLLAFVAKKFRKFDGQIFLMYIAWYGLGRAFIESLRTDSLVVGSVRISQMLAILCVIVAVILLLVIGSHVKRMGVDYHLYVDTAESRALLSATGTTQRNKQVATETDASDEAPADSKPDDPDTPTEEHSETEN
jgi:phosphatidylglycerol:prolipoprotein diacylglycerol transferase